MIDEAPDPVGDADTVAVNPALRAGFDALDRAGVRWCLLRGIDDLEHPTGDVDLLVADADARAADRALASVGAVHQRTWAGGSQRFFVLQDPDRAWLLVHVTTRLAFGSWYGLDTGAAAGVLRRRTSRAAVPAAAPADELWLSLLHCLLDKGRITDKHRRTLPLLAPAASPDDEIARSVAARCPGSWRPAELLELIGGGRWDEIGAVAGPLADEWRGAQPVRTRAASARHALSLWAHKLSEPVLRQGPSIALLAPDGAGKSTLAASLTDAMHVPVVVLYLGLYGQDMRRAPVDLPGAGFLTRFLTVRWRWTVGRVHRMRRRVVVFDRHPIEASMVDDGTRAARIARRVLARSAPLPDLVVVLDAPGEVLHARKPEHDVATLEERRQGYRRLAARLPDVLVVDATGSPEAVRQDVVDAIWGLQRRRAR